MAEVKVRHRKRGGSPENLTAAEQVLKEGKLKKNKNETMLQYLIFKCYVILLTSIAMEKNKHSDKYLNQNNLQKKKPT